MVVRILMGIFAGAFLVSPIISGDVDIDLAQISATTQTILEKVVLIVQLIASDGKPVVQGV